MQLSCLCELRIFCIKIIRKPFREHAQIQNSLSIENMKSHLNCRCKRRMPDTGQDASSATATDLSSFVVDDVPVDHSIMIADTNGMKETQEMQSIDPLSKSHMILETSGGSDLDGVLGRTITNPVWVRREHARK